MENNASKMNKCLAMLMALVLGSVLSACGTSHESTQNDAGSTSHSIHVAGITRTYRTFVPVSLNPKAPTSLVVMLHGGFGSASQAEQAYGWDKLAQAKTFIVAYPNGIDHAWNAGDCCGKPAREQVDDVAFVTAVVNAISTDYNIDPKRVYVTGMSNGAMMAQRLACETDIFAAVASVAGAQMVPCNNPKPISVLHIHGDQDAHVPLDGSAGNGIGKVPAHTPIETSLAHWRSADNCANPTTNTSASVTTATATCPSGRSVTSIIVANAGHQWPGSVTKNRRIGALLGADQPSGALNATDVIWSFFVAHPKPAR